MLELTEEKKGFKDGKFRFDRLEHDNYATLNFNGVYIFDIGCIPRNRKRKLVLVHSVGKLRTVCIGYDLELLG
jgi:hypothetical protein